MSTLNVSSPFLIYISLSHYKGLKWELPKEINLEIRKLKQFKALELSHKKIIIKIFFTFFSKSLKGATFNSLIFKYTEKCT